MNKIDYDRLVDIRREMQDLLQEAAHLVSCTEGGTYERAKAYWIGQIDIGLGEGNYYDPYYYSMSKTIEELKSDEDEDET